MEGLRLVSGTWEALGERCRSVRDEVFVAEQGVPIELEHDGRDPACWHVLGSDRAGVAVATGRLLPDGHLGRLAVRKPWRGEGVGAAVLALLIEEARARGHREVILNAQTTALGFYRSFGFVEVGEPFFEAGLAHQTMRLSLEWTQTSAMKATSVPPAGVPPGP